MLSTLLAGLAALLPARHYPSLATNPPEFFAHVRPVVLDFVAAKSAEYKVDLRIDESTWAIQDWFTYCQVLSAEIKGEHPGRALFAIRRDRRGPETYRVVSTCYKSHPSSRRAAELEIEGLPGERIFGDDEVAAIALPLVRKFLEAQGLRSDLDRAALEVRPSGIDGPKNRAAPLFRKVFGRQVSCRGVNVRRAGEAAEISLSVAIFHRAVEKVPYLPVDLQTVLKDPVSLRPYRFALVDGCDNLGMFAAPTLRVH